MKKTILLLILFGIDLLNGTMQPKINIQDVDLNSLHKLYAMSYTGEALYIPKKMLVDFHGKEVDLKELLNQHNVWPEFLWYKGETWKWKQAYSRLIERATKEKASYMISPEELPKLLLDAKTILKSFLITNDNDLQLLSDEYFEKFRINRLFTYAKLEQVIKEKSLTHVRLPLKMLVIRDKEAKNYISIEKSPEIIDDILKFSIDPGANIRITYDDNRYDLIIFAQREHNAGNFNTAARTELSMLCQEAPFDVGYNNIFSDKKGNAVIIDTEFKGEPARTACPKLNRYKVDYKKRVD